MYDCSCMISVKISLLILWYADGHLESRCGKSQLLVGGAHTVAHQHTYIHTCSTASSDVASTYYYKMLTCFLHTGGHPYPSLGNRALLGYLLRGKKLEKPKNCSEEWYQLYIYTWVQLSLACQTFDWAHLAQLSVWCLRLGSPVPCFAVNCIGHYTLVTLLFIAHVRIHLPLIPIHAQKYMYISTVLYVYTV